MLYVCLSEPTPKRKYIIQIWKICCINTDVIMWILAIYEIVFFFFHSPFANVCSYTSKNCYFFAHICCYCFYHHSSIWFRDISYFKASVLCKYTNLFLVYKYNLTEWTYMWSKTKGIKSKTVVWLHTKWKCMWVW